MVARQLARRGDHIEYSFWLTFDDRGGIRLTRTEPSCDRRERTMALIARLPLSLWSIPSLRAEITIAGGDVPIPVIDVQAAQSALRDIVGCDVVMTIRESDGE